MDEDLNASPVGEAEADEQRVGELEDTMIPGAGRVGAVSKFLECWIARKTWRNPSCIMSGDWDRSLRRPRTNALVSSIIWFSLDCTLG